MTARTRRRPRTGIALLLSGFLALALVGAGCGEDDDSSGPGTTTTTTGEVDVEYGPGTGRVTTSDGLDASLAVHPCTNHGETDLALEADSPDGGKLVVIADGDATSITWRAPGDEREGTVATVQVGDTGNFTLSGKLSTADDSAAPATFELLGTCPVAGAATSTTS